MAKKRLFFALVALSILVAPPAEASFLDDLKTKITDRATQLKKLDEEITQFQAQIFKTQAEKRTLQAELNLLESTDKQLFGELKKTETSLKQTDRTIILLGSEILTKQEQIQLRRQGITQALRALREAENITLIEVLAEQNTLSDFLNSTYAIDAVQKNLYRDIDLLQNDALTLAAKKRAEEEAKITLARMKAELADKKQLVTQNKSTKATLLSSTKSQEAAYQAQLADRLAKRKAVEAELKNIEEQLRVTIDPKSLPQSGSKVLSWPLANIKITQYFGNTDFSSRNPQLYNGKGHNGVDLGAPIGTPIMVAAGGIVKGIGDTDSTCQGASYGKWVLIEHGNGLSTLYAHLSLIKAGEGQNVSTGDLIGYTGNTGYSTGPHLHFTVYASQGVKVGSLKSKVPGCGTYRLPIASYNSYLNPLAYLP